MISMVVAVMCYRRDKRNSKPADSEWWDAAIWMMN